MTSSLVGSEMCIRDRKGAMTQYGEVMPGSSDSKSDIVWVVPVCRLTKDCLLYTSDAADDM
eukprot:10801267-Prorocentrum_lima.AAC.1